MRIAICDDDKAVREYISEVLSRDIENDIIIKTYSNGEALCKALKKGAAIDLLFLDIELDTMNGIQVAEYIRNTLKNLSLQIVYISAGDSHCMEMFEAGPLNFLMKPLSEEKILQQVKKAKVLLESGLKSFKYTKGSNIVNVKVADILYFESMSHEVRIVTLAGEDYFSGKISDIKEMGQFGTFYDIHRCYFVNMDAIKVYKYKEIVMLNGDVIQISQSSRTEFRKMQLKRLKGELQ